MDVTAVTGYLTTDITPAITAVGAGILTLAAVAMGFKWIKGMMF